MSSSVKVCTASVCFSFGLSGVYYCDGNQHVHLLARELPNTSKAVRTPPFPGKNSSTFSEQKCKYCPQKIKETHKLWQESGGCTFELCFRRDCWGEWSTDDRQPGYLVLLGPHIHQDHSSCWV